jgi:DNA-binding transcriptional regulator GbsR (MarR family)
MDDTTNDFKMAIETAIKENLKEIIGDTKEQIKAITEAQLELLKDEIKNKMSEALNEVIASCRGCC